MAKSAWGWRFVAGGVLLAGAGLACSSGDGQSPSDATPSDATPSDATQPALAPNEREFTSEEIQYQFVETADGMTVEAVSATDVQTVSCATRTCAGFCDECAVAACRASGQLGSVCEALQRECANVCTCNSEFGAINSCGFPICATNRNLCYISADGAGAAPGEPPAAPGGPDPSPVDPASRPPEASRPESARAAY